jgi:GNAT superfamily N-acetyltransferase
MAFVRVERPCPPNRIVIREAGDADLGRIVTLLRLGELPGGPASLEDPDDLGPYRAALSEISGTSGDILVADPAGEVVGVCQLIVFRHLLATGGRCAEIESVHVHPDRRGAGVGRALLDGAVSRARALGCYRVQLTSNTARPDAHRFYERFGWRRPTSDSRCSSSDDTPAPALAIPA